MSFFQAITRSRMSADQQGWKAAAGLVDPADGESLEAQARSVRSILAAWPMVMLAQIVMLVAPGMDVFHQALLQPHSLMIGSALLLANVAVMGGGLIARVTRIPPHRQLALLMPLMVLCGGLYALAALNIHPLAMMPGSKASTAILLVPMLVTAVVSSRRPFLGATFTLGVAGCVLSVFPAIQLIIAIVAAAVCQILAVMLALRIDATATPSRQDGSLRGEQARALITDFEEAGRGWFWETDRHGNITYVSGTLARQLGKRADELVGMPMVSLVASRGANAEADGERTLGFHLSSRTAFSEIAVLAAGTREERWWSVSGRPVNTEFGQFMGFRGSGSDLTEIKRSQAEVTRLARFDSLTGLANRSQMNATLEQALAGLRGTNNQCALFMLDLDRFKQVNDTLGHPAGDALLQQVSQRLVRLVGTHGKVGRLGGDEFQIVIAGKLDKLQLARLAEAIIHNLSQPYSIEGSQVDIGASVGIAIAPEDGSTAETVTRNADLALYAAKGDGRGVFRFYAPSMHSEADARRQLELDLRQALITGGLFLAYQPVVCASTERITGYEALLRWSHPTKGPISPAVFIPIAEDAGLISAIGEWVMRTACAEAAGWPGNVRVAVNVSPIQFANASFPALVMNALASTGLAPDRLELEITESVFVSQNSDTDGMFASLKSIGVRLALDDFGTGYSALGYLKTAPFDKIKIDQSFVRGAAIRGSRNAAIVKAIVSLAEALGMETTAEGAETLDELALIRSLGCSHVQGYVYGRPVEAALVRETLAMRQGYASPIGLKVSREPRQAILRRVTLSHGSRQYHARIRNISTGGAMIEGLTGVPAGTTFNVEITPELVVKAFARWSTEDRMGVEFEAPINLELLRPAVEKAAAARSETVPMPASPHPQAGVAMPMTVPVPAHVPLPSAAPAGGQMAPAAAARPLATDEQRRAG